MSDEISYTKYNELRQLGYKTIQEMYEEYKQGLRPPITPEDVKKSVELERSIYPDWIVYPKDNNIYEAIEDVVVRYMTNWRIPYTGGGKATFPKGEKVKVSPHPYYGDEPTSVYCDPINKKELHSLIVPETVRNAPHYGGYYFSIDTLTLNTKFKLIHTTDDRIKRKLEKKLLGR